MKKLLCSLGLAALLVFAVAGTASAQSPTLAGASSGNFASSWATVAPTVSAIDPVSGANDIDTSVTITGADFVATPTVSLGSTALTNVTWVNSTTLTATVPWGMDPGAYTLTVVNPDGGSVTLPSAFTVTSGHRPVEPRRASSAGRCSSSS